LGLEVAPLALDKVLNLPEGAPEAVLNPIFALVAAPAIIFLRRIKTHFALDHFFRALHIKRYIVKASLVSPRRNSCARWFFRDKKPIYISIKQQRCKRKLRKRRRKLMN
jgi:hypothetical protein